MFSRGYSLILLQFIVESATAQLLIKAIFKKTNIMEDPMCIYQHTLPHTPVHSHKRKFESPLPSPDRLKRVALEYVSHVDLVGSAPSRDGRLALARTAAQQLHKTQMLSPYRTIVVRRENPPSSPDTFIATHPKFNINTILIQEQAQDAQCAALRVFFDCLYAQCGYKPWYQRENFGNVPYLEDHSIV